MTSNTTSGGYSIQEVARRSGFSEPTLRYYEKIGLIGSVGRDESSGHRRYSAAALDTIQSLSCLRSAGLTVDDLRRYLRLRELGTVAAADQRELFASAAERLAAEIDRLQVRLTYLHGKAELWDARERGDITTESRVTDELLAVLERF